MHSFNIFGAGAPVKSLSLIGRNQQKYDLLITYKFTNESYTYENESSICWSRPIKDKLLTGATYEKILKEKWPFLTKKHLVGDLYLEDRVSQFGSWEHVSIDFSINDTTVFESRFQKNKFLLLVLTQKLNFISLSFVKVFINCFFKFIY